MLRLREGETSLPTDVHCSNYLFVKMKTSNARLRTYYTRVEVGNHIFHFCKFSNDKVAVKELAVEDFYYAGVLEEVRCALVASGSTIGRRETHRFRASASLANIVVLSSLPYTHIHARARTVLLRTT